MYVNMIKRGRMFYFFSYTLCFLKCFLIQGKSTSSSFNGDGAFRTSKVLWTISAAIQAETMAGRTVSPKWLVI